MPFPSKRTPEIEREILERLSNGEPLARICRDSGMPHPSNWREWCKSDQALSIAYMCARDDGFDAIANQCLEIADESSKDTIGYGNEEGRVISACNSEWISRSRLRVDTRLKLLAKWDPKRYGEKLDVNTTVQGVVNVVIGGDA